MTTRAPASANRRTVAAPSPDAPPVTSAPVPAICMIGSPSSLNYCESNSGV